MNIISSTAASVQAYARGFALELWCALHRMWANGGRRFLVVTTLTNLILIMLLGYQLWWTIQQQTFMPLQYENPQRVSNPRGADGIPIVRLGETVNVTAVKCVKSSQPLAVVTDSVYESVGATKLRVGFNHGPRVMDPGCFEGHYANLIPSGVTPGLWRIVGAETVSMGGLQQVAGWYTEPFRVVRE